MATKAVQDEKIAADKKAAEAVAEAATAAAALEKDWDEAVLADVDAKETAKAAKEAAAAAAKGTPEEAAAEAAAGVAAGKSYVASTHLEKVLKARVAQAEAQALAKEAAAAAEAAAAHRLKLVANLADGAATNLVEANNKLVEAAKEAKTQMDAASLLRRILEGTEGQFMAFVDKIKTAKDAVGNAVGDAVVGAKDKVNAVVEESKNDSLEPWEKVAVAVLGVVAALGWTVAGVALAVCHSKERDGERAEKKSGNRW